MPYAHCSCQVLMHEPATPKVILCSGDLAQCEEGGARYPRRGGVQAAGH